MRRAGFCPLALLTCVAVHQQRQPLALALAHKGQRRAQRLGQRLLRHVQQRQAQVAKAPGKGLVGEGHVEDGANPVVAQSGLVFRRVLAADEQQLLHPTRVRVLGSLNEHIPAARLFYDAALSGFDAALAVGLSHLDSNRLERLDALRQGLIHQFHGQPKSPDSPPNCQSAKRGSQ